MRVGGLFSGIGGWELGLERAGMQVVWHCEQDPFCKSVLEHHWPGVPVYPDVRELRGADVEPVDVLCGGFPCQDISFAGVGAGLDGARSGLWSEYARLVGELRPRYVLVENVAALLARGLGRVLSDLSALGYDAEWDCLPASAVGAPHRRDRVWVVAYPNGDGEPHGAVDAQARGDASLAGRRDLGDSEGNGCGAGWSRRSDPAGARERESERALQGVGHADSASEDAHAAAGGPRRAARESGGWLVEPGVGRVAHGIPARVDRLRSLGNALVPDIAEWIGRRVLAYEQARNE